MNNVIEKKEYSRASNVIKFIALSVIGIFMFFIQITVNGKSSVPVEFIVSYIMANFLPLAKIYAMIFIIVGTIYPFVKKTWNSSPSAIVFSLLKIVGVVLSFLIYFNVGPAAILDPNIGPFLFTKLGVNVGILIPIGAIFLTFLIGYGFVDFAGLLLRPVMKAIWKTPGRSAVDAVASFVGSSALGILITSGIYNEKKYTTREACIIVTGFSTVAVTFMIVVAQTLSLMDHWNIFFGTTFVITFLITAITARIWPLSKKTDTYINNEEGFPEEKIEGNLFASSFNEGLKICDAAKPLHIAIKEALRDSMFMVMDYLPSLMSIGLIGLLVAEKTPLFDYVGYIFYPLTAALQLPEPFLAAKAISMGVAEMFLPALVAAGAPIVTKFVMGVGCISGILMLSCTIPCILSTNVPLTLKELVIVWFERTVLALIIAAPIAHFLF